MSTAKITKVVALVNPSYTNVPHNDVILTPTVKEVCLLVDWLDKGYKKHRSHHVIFISYADGTGYRLIYDKDPKAPESPMQLRLRHYTDVPYFVDWDTDEAVTVKQAKQIIGDKAND